MIDHRDLPLTEKIMAMLSLHGVVDFCSRHKIYYYSPEHRHGEVFLCPICFGELEPNE